MDTPVCAILQYGAGLILASASFQVYFSTVMRNPNAPFCM